MRLLATALIAALPGFVFAQEVAGTTVIDGREVTLYANGTWEFATRREGSCALIARNVEFCGENLHITDVDGNRIFYRLPRIAFSPKSIPSDGKGTWPFKAAAGRHSGRKTIFSVQMFPAS